MDSLFGLDDVCGVMSMLNLHFSVFADVNDFIDASLRVHSRFYRDIHIKSLVSFFLAVLNAQFFAGTLSNEGLRVHAV